MIRMLSAVLVLLMPFHASAGYFDGNSLHEDCQRKDRGLAFGYIIGIHDQQTDIAYAQAEDGRQVKKKQFMCVPDKVKAGQLLDIACNYVRDHPAERHLPGSVLVTRSFVVAYPCPN